MCLEMGDAGEMRSARQFKTMGIDSPKNPLSFSLSLSPLLLNFQGREIRVFPCKF